jgi:hypothetical protein
MSHRSATPQRTELPFDPDEWELLVKLPGRVVVAATSAQADPPWRTVAEGLAGLDAIAAGRASASRLVRDVVTAIYAETGEDPPVAGKVRERTADVLAGCRSAARVLAERASREDFDAYRHWLEAIAARVCRVARTGGVLGVGGQLVSPAERKFLAELGAAFDG